MQRSDGLDRFDRHENRKWRNHKVVAQELWRVSGMTALMDFMDQSLITVSSQEWYFMFSWPWLCDMALCSKIFNVSHNPKLRAGRPRDRSSNPGRVRNFLFSKSSRPVLRSTEPPIQWVPGALPPGLKRPGREVDHSPPTSAEVKKMWIYTSTSHTPS
jgi:hypothetical protein